MGWGILSYLLFKLWFMIKEKLQPMKFKTACMLHIAFSILVAYSNSILDREGLRTMGDHNL